ncbi:anti-sigma regulatory factor (Ser/Thr protein kinase) [Streptomyces brevispora]|uniref:Anti-sigma regulatory factor (Ser/Thr protein kinase) n=1 Tax=Streptomyces brevispora TaxID=887462 RepID=A0A561V1D0_9ACTN|nr:anti-sigma regulatory factor (Ser/Thr protein kinase) [Streptomyces brevispora]
MPWLIPFGQDALRCWSWEVIGVIDTEGDCTEWSFPAVPGAVRTARHAVHEALRGWGIDTAVGDVAVLLVSELVTNSMRYTPGPIDVRLVRPHPNGDGPVTHPALLVEVSDPLPDPPTERRAGPDDEGGRGLQLVACSARRWGTRRGKTGKTVWFELALPG